MKTLRSNKHRYLLAIIGSFTAHLLALGVIYVAASQVDKHHQTSSGTEKKIIKVQIKAVDIAPQIIEAPLEESQLEQDHAYLGRQNHQAKKASKLPHNTHTKGADASNRLDSLQPFQKKDKSLSNDKKGYLQLLPRDQSSAASFRDLIIDPSIPEANILDVNTAQFELIGYFTSVRKMVDFAFYDPRSSLRHAPRIKKELVRSGQVSFRGYSRAKITVERSGLVTKIETLDSSEDPELDQTWIRILNLAAPFPPLPHYFKEERLIFSYTLYYDIVIKDKIASKRYHF